MKSPRTAITTPPTTSPPMISWRFSFGDMAPEDRLTAADFRLSLRLAMTRPRESAPGQEGCGRWFMVED
jgi:hypothetical protein